MTLYSDAELAQILDKKIFRCISQVADEEGVEAYVVGGFVPRWYPLRFTNGKPKGLSVKFP